MANKYLLNAFSFQMIDCNAGTIEFQEVESFPADCISAIGHQDTANVLGVEMNRVNVRLNPGDIAYIAQLQGGRLPEGSTTLPEGFSFKFIKVELKVKVENNNMVGNPSYTGLRISK